MKRISELMSGILFTLLAVSLSVSGQNPNLQITTTSSSEYSKSPKTSIYPAFVDNIIYQSWTEAGPSPFFQLTAQGGTPPYTWSIASGNLPKGLRLDKTGKIQGMASKEGNYAFTAQVTDSKGASITKPLVFEAAPYRSKWFSDAKFGLFIQWGVFTQPSLKGKDGIAQFEKRITKFNADEWAQNVIDLGGKVLTVTINAGDGVRLWPSTTPSKLELKTQRNLVKELIDACHKKGIKFVAYFAPDKAWNKDVVDTGLDGTYGTLNLGLIKELVLMGVDGLWIDMTSATELYNFDYNWFPWNKMIPIMRANNPKLIFANNTGIYNGGTVLQYPNTDVIIYEGGTSQFETALEVAKPTTVKKKLAIEVDNLLDNTWSWREDPKLRNPKPLDMMIRNIKKNWEAGATYILSYPVPANGDILPEIYRDELKQIASFVKKNQGWSETPRASLSDTIDYDKAQKLTLTASARSKIYYTVDGNRPTTASKLYKTPIPVSKTCRIQAISVEAGKPASKVFDQTFTVLTNSNRTAVNARSAAPAATLATKEAAGKTEPNGFYRGMRITVGPTPIRLTDIGRKYLQGNKDRHSIVIRRFTDDQPILTASLNTAILPVADDGYQYAPIPPTVLEAGKAYLIGISENATDQFAPDDLKNAPSFADYRIVQYSILSAQGTRKPITDDKTGQLLGLKYEKVNVSGAKINLALGKQAFLRANNDTGLGPASQIYFAENAVDGDFNTMAAAGGQYPWTLLVDLTKVETGLKQAKITFAQTAYSTEFQVMASPDNKTWTTLMEKKNNSDRTIDIKFDPIDARYFKIRSFKPEKQGETGRGMGIMEFELYR